MALLGPACASGAASTLRRFPDLPVAWQEHDDVHVPNQPAATESKFPRVAYGMTDFVVREIDRTLSLETPRPAADVNALDEVPCSTWYCPRNHVAALTPDEVAAGPPEARPPVLPLTVVGGKGGGVSPGFLAVDARGRRYLLKLDPLGYLALATGAEAVVQRLVYAAGYNVSGAYAIDVSERELLVDPRAELLHHGFEPRRYTPEVVKAILDRSARTAEGKLRIAAIQWIEGTDLGAFDYLGRRTDDPNDRLRHEDRRSLRASWVLFAWLDNVDVKPRNTVDSYVEHGDRRFVRHYLVDFGSALGAFSNRPKTPRLGGERVVELTRVARALVTLGSYRRPWQRQVTAWRETLRDWPEIGWFPSQTWDPSTFRTDLKVPAHQRMTARDAYWGAKVVTSFTDEQIHAAVAQGGYSAAAAAIIELALRERRDRIGSRYLTGVTAIEAPIVGPQGRSVCFRDLAIERGAALPSDVNYRFEVGDGDGRPLVRGVRSAAGPSACLPIGGTKAGDGYRVLAVEATVNGRPAKAARVHLAWRDHERRFVVVGLERDE